MDPVKDTLLPDQTQIVRNNTIPPLSILLTAISFISNILFRNLAPLNL